MTRVRVTHKPSGEVLAVGPLGWGITPFEGNLYIRRKFVTTDKLRVNYVPGICIYKFLYVWLDLDLPNDERSHNLAWLYWLPNPLLPFIWFRIALPRRHPELRYEEL